MQAARGAVPELVRLFDSGGIASLPDDQLLERYVVQRDELAFEMLVASHGPMVLGVCRRQLGDSSAVDDAFQATFLVLIRRAATLGAAVPLGAWLHGVAVRVARQARKQAARRGARERLGLGLECVPGREGPASDPDLGRILDEEIARLPDRYRFPVVLCYLEGITHEEAARRLGWPLGSVKGRLARARSLLQSRLTRRGVAGSVGAGALVSGGYSQAALPAAFIRIACKALLGSGDGGVVTLAAVISEPVQRLVEGAVGTMVLFKLRLFAVTLGVSGIFLGGVGVMARQAGGPKPEHKPSGPSVVAPGKVADQKAALKPVELKKEESPPAGLARRPESPPTKAELEALDAAREALRVVSDRFRANQLANGAERVHNTSKLLLETEVGLARSKAERDAAYDAHRDRMRELARSVGEGDPQATLSAAETRAYFALAALQAERAKSAPESSTPPLATDPLAPRSTGVEPHREGAMPVTTTPATTDPGGAGKDPKSRLILSKLEQPVPMNFPNETPLEEVLQYIRQATQGKQDTGLAIYVDPGALKEAEVSLTSPISINLEGVPLKHTLRLLLKQLGLAYTVKEGFMLITSEGSELEESEYSQKRQRVERGEMPLDELKSLVEELKLRRQALQEFSAPLYRDGHPAEETSSKDDTTEIRKQLKEVKELLEQIKAERAAGKKADGPKSAQ